MSLIFEPVYSWPLVIITSVALLSVVILTYPASIRHLSPFWKRCLFSLRLLAAVVLIFAMLRPAIQYSESDSQLSQLLVLMDRSRSMSTADGPGGLTRRQAILKTIEDAQPQIDDLGEEVEVRFFDFSTDLSATNTPENATDGDFTSIGKALDDLREQERSDRIIGTVFMTDGAQRAGGEQDVDPLSAARRFAEQRGVPVHSVVYGTSELSTSGIDLAIEDLSLDQPETFERKTVPVKMQLRLLGAAGRTVRVKLLIEDRTGKALGESGELVEIPLSAEAEPFQEVRVTENAITVPMELSFVAERSGEYKIAAEVEPANGEVKLRNNRLETLITVRKGGLKVAYFDVPRPEQSFISRLNETAKIQIDTQVILAGSLAKNTIIEPKLFAPDAYDAYIIGDVPASVFEASQGDLLGQLAQRVQEGAGLAMIGGLHNFGAGGYADTELADLLPIRMSVADEIGWDEDAPRQHFNQPLQMVPTPDGVRHYLMRLTSANNEELWRTLPEMSGANRLIPKSGAVGVLAETTGGDPLLLVSDTGRGRTLALGVDETWRWYLRGFQAEHQRFWQQLVLWLAHKEFESDAPVWVRVEPRNFSPMAKVPIEFGARDADGNPLTDVNYQVEVIKPDGETETVTARRFDDHGLADFMETQQPGDYWVRVSASTKEASLGVSALSRFIVDARDLEMDNPAADPETMNEIAELTGGSIVAPEDFGAFLERLLEEGVPEELQRFKRINLWDGWPLLLIFAGLLSMEWTIRKLRGMV